MSYNGIGLSTVRGSGTNGYVQRNLSAVRRIREKVGMLSEDQANADSSFEKKPNLELLEHDRKRRVELKCMELQDLMEEQGYDEEEITKKVNSYRQMLSESQDSLPGKEDASGRPIITETHQIAEMKEKENETLRAAFGIGKDYVKGSAFSKFDAPPNKEESKNYKLVRTPSRSPSPSHSKAKKKSEKKERKRSYDESDHSRKKSRKKAVSDNESSSNEDSSPGRRSKKSKHSKHHKKKEKHSKHSKSSKHKKTKKSRRRSSSHSSSDS